MADFGREWPVESNSICIGFDRISLTCVRLDVIKFALSELFRVLKPGGIFGWIVSDTSDFIRLGDLEDDGWVEQSRNKDIQNRSQFRGYTFLSYKDVIDLTSKFSILNLSLKTEEFFIQDATRRKRAYWIVDLIKANYDD